MNDKYVGIIFFVAFMHARIIIQLNNITGPSVDGRYGHRGNKANHIFFLFVFLHFLTVCTEQWLFLLFAFFVRLLCRRIKSCVSVALFFGHCECAFGLIHGFACFNHSNVLSRVGGCVDRRSAAGIIRKPIVSTFFSFQDRWCWSFAFIRGCLVICVYVTYNKHSNVAQFGNFRKLYGTIMKYKSEPIHEFWWFHFSTKKIKKFWIIDVEQFLLGVKRK